MQVLRGRVDPVYKYVTHDDEYLRWIKDVGFLRKEYERLGTMFQLGLVQKVHPLIRHTCREHHEGVSYLAQRATDALSNSAFAPTDKKTFRFAAAVHGIGHLPMGYDTEVILQPLIFKHPDLGTTIISNLGKVK